MVTSPYNPKHVIPLVAPKAQAGQAPDIAFLGYVDGTPSIRVGTVGGRVAVVMGGSMGELGGWEVELLINLLSRAGRQVESPANLRADQS